MQWILRNATGITFAFLMAALSTITTSGARDQRTAAADAAVQSTPNMKFAQVRPGTSPLKRRDPPPPTIRPQLVSQDPAGDELITCVVGRDTGGNPRAIASECIAEITDQLSIWFREFETSGGKLIGTIQVSITRPDGSVTGLTISEDNRGEPIYFAPGAALGRYSFVARAAGRSVTGGFTVKAPAKRILLVIEADREIRGGQSVAVHLAGYRPSERVTLYLYLWFDHRDVGTGETIFKYATVLGSTTTDRRGEAVFSFPTEPDDPPGSYLVASSPAQQNFLFSGIFQVTR
jgi:hypothetical protein